VTSALVTGYRHIDTAAAYGNERPVGEAVHTSEVGRSEVILETKSRQPRHRPPWRPEPDSITLEGFGREIPET
jgi:diketogulonate reductase-like aldo/keto reductase